MYQLPLLQLISSEKWTLEDLAPVFLGSATIETIRQTKLAEVKEVLVAMGSWLLESPVEWRAQMSRWFVGARVRLQTCGEALLCLAATV